LISQVKGCQVVKTGSLFPNKDVGASPTSYEQCFLIVKSLDMVLDDF
jgi:hypothetical protein